MAMCTRHSKQNKEKKSHLQAIYKIKLNRKRKRCSLCLMYINAVIILRQRNVYGNSGHSACIQCNWTLVWRPNTNKNHTLREQWFLASVNLWVCGSAINTQKKNWKEKYRVYCCNMRIYLLFLARKIHFQNQKSSKKSAHNS